MSLLTDDASQTDEKGGTGNSSGAGDVQKPTWIEQLPEAMRSDESLYGYKTIGDLVTAHKTASAERDGLIKVPGEGATAEEIAAFRKALGVPTSQEEYKIGKPEGYPEGLPYDENVAKAFSEFAHKENIPTAQVQKLWAWYNDLVKRGYEDAEAKGKATVQESVETLTKEWGLKYSENAEIAVRAFKRFGAGSEALLDKQIDGVKIGDHPAFMKLFYGIGKAIADDTTGPRGNTDGNPDKTDEEKAIAFFPSMRKKE